MLTKKWLFAGIFTLLSLSLALAAPPAVHPTTGAPLVITCLRGTPDAIDGDLSDWNLAAMTPAVVDAPAQVYTGQASWTGPADCSGKFYVLWDDKNIYFGIEVKDDTLSMNKTGADIWNADCAKCSSARPNAVPRHPYRALPVGFQRQQPEVVLGEPGWRWGDRSGVREARLGQNAGWVHPRNRFRLQRRPYPEDRRRQHDRFPRRA